MFSARSFIAVAASLSLACACVFFQPSKATAQTIDLSLNVFYTNPSDLNSGGTWKLVAKSSNFGIAGLVARITGAHGVADLTPSGTVNGNMQAGFNANAEFFVPANGSTPAYWELDSGQAPFDLAPGQEQGIFYGVGQLANGSPDYTGKPVGTNSEGPHFNSLTAPFEGIPWGTGDVFGNSIWNVAAAMDEGSFDPGSTPAFAAGNQGNVFTSIGTSTVAGTVAAATITTIVRTNFVAGIAADYNHNGIVDAADYVLWRNTLNQNVTPGSGADGSGNGVIDQADYALWKSNFGNHSGPGAGSGSLSTSAVPEPAGVLLSAIGAVAFCCGFRKRSQGSGVVGGLTSTCRRG